MKVYLETYGCSANKSDSEIILGLLKKNNFEITYSPITSDVNIINTCIVKTPTAKKMESRIKYLSSLGKPLIVAGCMSKAEKERIEKIAPKASMISPDAIEKIVEVVNATLEGKKMIVLEGKVEKPCLPFLPFNKIISIVQISSGCLSTCSFCETRFARGILKSYKPSLILEKIKKDLKNGFKEFWITSQDNSCYGFDIKTDIGELLKCISQIEGEFYVRIGMMNPYHLIKNREILFKLIEVLKDKKFFKFIHLPLQSGSNKILKDMNRNHSIEEYIEIVNILRKEIPEIRIETDIIVGYPTETEEDFEKTIETINKLKFDAVNISKFSSRPKTPASKLKELDVNIVKKRSKILSEIVKEILLEKNKRYFNNKIDVFIDEIGTKPRSFIGRSMNYLPVVVKSSDYLLGREEKITIKEIRSNFIIGEL
ncbi:MAG: tRNA (N(6)-L-threonylcarbamoyladenosine(37)-C(2))-methylthiotransferase [Candidatus Aenigmatarchaeota archaeon]